MTPFSRARARAPNQAMLSQSKGQHMATRPALKRVAAASVPPAIRTLRMEIAGLAALETALTGEMGSPFDAACALIHASRGRAIVTGMGKSGHIGAKIAATLSSTGTPAFFVHPAEASHGDLGTVTPHDVIL